ncbi:Rad52/Rad22 family DNA repair protein [Halalkalibacter krulwichiae]|uniref:Single-stranded DNA-binding protein DdrA n=1 Tax=Halalkalibacter krulwichiae TaxID=199441 RepID=A0A1Y9THJ7_9BACI|nr:Rad52/Rad22 family DNA repair protein [Halalkalibacter krulwichiae]ARK28749.1 Single-stranded DNA-binding protein DdrA [Halalkalibacter krulwichiae]
MSDQSQIMKRLQEPFPYSDIEWRVGSTTKDKTKGLALAYVTNRAIQNRLDDIFGPFGWKNEYKEWKGSSQLCGISIKHEGEWITKWDGASDSNQEAVKGGLSDSMKRAAYQWGIGRYLYKIPQMWCELKPIGKSYALKKNPALPAWALPKGNQEDASQSELISPPIEEEPTMATDQQKENIKGTIIELSAMRNTDVNNIYQALNMPPLEQVTYKQAEAALKTLEKWFKQAQQKAEQS